MLGTEGGAAVMMAPDMDDARLVTSLATIDEVLDRHAPELGADLIAYRNHVYRVVNLCVAIAGHRGVAVEQVAVAAVFHDLGIWTHRTFDYLTPSMALARQHLTSRGLAGWIPEIEAMIAEHHKVTAAGTDPRTLVESFRRADWIDVSRGVRRFGVPRACIAAVATRWPSEGFHRRLVQLTVRRFLTHPLTPLPMVKW